VQSDGGAVQKCELCTQNDGIPACAAHCPNQAIVFEEGRANA
jgi:Fe-S-cluster-containing hydrogenase component 2